MAKSPVQIHHDTRPLKTCLVTLPRLQTMPHRGTTPSMSSQNFCLLPRLPSGRFDKRSLSQSPNQIRAGNVCKFKTNVAADLDGFLNAIFLKEEMLPKQKRPFDDGSKENADSSTGIQTYLKWKSW